MSTPARGLIYRHGVGWTVYFRIGVWRCLVKNKQNIVHAFYLYSNCRLGAHEAYQSRGWQGGFMHIGRNIRKKLKEDGHSVTWFAEQICCTRTHVYKIFNRSSIDTEVLIRICQVLNHDFFEDMSKEFNERERNIQ